MGQTRGAIAGLEQGLALARLFQPFDQLARFLEGPGARSLRGLEEIGVKGGQGGGRHGVAAFREQRKRTKPGQCTGTGRTSMSQVVAARPRKA
ncbi:hypothetical protein D3C87_1759640 [compost metagenome]